PGSGEGRRSPTWHAGGTATAAAQPAQINPVETGAEPVEASVVDSTSKPAGPADQAPAPAVAPEPASTVTPRAESEVSAAPVGQEDEVAGVGDLLSEAGERLELAKAYAELGD